MSAQPGVGTVLPWELSNNAPGPAPYTVTIPASLEVQPYTSTATYDGTDADGDFVPTLSIYSQTGALLARVFPAATVKAGDTATVTYLPPFGSAASSPATGGGIQFDTYPQAGGWLDIETTGADSDGFGINLNDTGFQGINIQSGGGGVVFGQGDYAVQLGSFNGIELQAEGGIFGQAHGGNIELLTDNCEVLLDASTGQVYLKAQSEGGVKIDVTHVVPLLQIIGLPTTNPGGSGLVWNNGGVLNIT